MTANWRLKRVFTIVHERIWHGQKGVVDVNSHIDTCDAIETETTSKLMRPTVTHTPYASITAQSQPFHFIVLLQYTSLKRSCHVLGRMVVTRHTTAPKFRQLRDTMSLSGFPRLPVSQFRQLRDMSLSQYPGTAVPVWQRRRYLGMYPGTDVPTDYRTGTSTRSLLLLPTAVSRGHGRKFFLTKQKTWEPESSLDVLCEQKRATRNTISA